jgi:hypothetical protein
MPRSLHLFALSSALVLAACLDNSSASPGPDGSTDDSGTTGLDSGTEGSDASDATLPNDAPDAPSPNDATAPSDGSDAGTTSACVVQGIDASAGAAVSSLNTAGVQNLLAGVTPDGTAILLQRETTQCTNGLSLFIADESASDGGVYSVLPVPALTGFGTGGGEESITLAADGLTLVGTNTASTGFVSAARSARGMNDFTVSGSDFAAIQVTGSQTVWGPVLSPDELTFYYSVIGDPSSAVNGIYDSVRTSTSVPFPAGTRMQGDMQGLAQYVTAVSSDGLTLFVEEAANYVTAILTRASLADPFTNPLAPNSPPLAPGYRAHPILGCNAFLGTCAPNGGGCTGEEICLWGP